MNDAKPRVLVIGCGSIGERHIRTFLATGRVRVTGCDPRPEIQSRIAATYCVPTVGDAREVETDRDISAVVVATPAPSHIPLAIAALAQGRHVLIEKPLAVALAGVDELVAARDRAKKFASVAYVYHCQPGLHAAREFLRWGCFGRVRHAAVNTGHDFPDARPAYRKIYYRDHAQGGGAIQDALIHMANAVEWILGPTESVYCDASHQVLDGVDVEDTVNLAARNGGALVTYSLNQFQASTKPSSIFMPNTEPSASNCMPNAGARLRAERRIGRGPRPRCWSGTSSSARRQTRFSTAAKDARTRSVRWRKASRRSDSTSLPYDLGAKTARLSHE